MKTRQENREEEGRQFLAEFQELYRQLSAWQRVQFNLCIKWIVLQRHWGKLVWDWLIFQWTIDENINIHVARSAGRRSSLL